MSDVNAAATLTLAITTGGAEKKLEDLKTAYAELKKELGADVPVGRVAKGLSDELGGVKKLVTEQRAMMAALGQQVSDIVNKMDQGVARSGDAAKTLVASYSHSMSGLSSSVSVAMKESDAATKKAYDNMVGFSKLAKDLSFQQIPLSFKIDREYAGIVTKEARAAFEASVQYDRAWTEAHAVEVAKRAALDTKARETATKYALMSPRQQAQSVVSAATAISMNADVSKYAPEALAAAQNVEKLTAAKAALVPITKQVTHEQNNWNEAAKNGHAFARGLSGSLGALWMTYGNLLPLMAGAALAGGFKAAATAGAEFAYQLTFVKALGGESAQAVAEIGTAALQMSKTSMYGPGELANGLRMLSQAGLSARDSMVALPAAMNLATVGEMNMEQATLTLVGVMNAFSMGIGDLTHIGDMFAKAAALSQTSVSQMTEAMKTASVVHDQYGASIEDTATALTLLAKVNIVGTAAGTSYRNMLKDLYTPSKEAARVMKDLRIETKDANGNLREAPAIMADLKAKLQGFTSGSQTDIIGKIFSERGGKEAIQMLAAVGTKWDELKAKISNSDGFMAGVTAELEMTTKGRFQQALNTMQANMVSAFSASEGPVRNLADSLRNLADSPAFVSGINAIVGSMATLANVVVNLTPALLGLGAAWGALALTSGLSTGWIAATQALSGFTSGLQASVGVMGPMLTTTASMRGVLGGLVEMLTSTKGAAGVAAVAVGGLWYVMQQGSAASDAATRAGDSFIDVLNRSISKIDQEIAKLKERNRLMSQGFDPNDQTASDLNASQQEQKRLESEIAKRRKALGSSSTYSYANRDERASLGDGTVEALEKQLATVTERTKTLSTRASEQLSESTREFILKGREEVAKFDRGAASVVTSASTAVEKERARGIEQASASMKQMLVKLETAGNVSAKELREYKEQFENLKSQSAMALIGSGQSKYTMPKAEGSSGANAALNDAYQARLTALRGYLQEQEQTYAQSQQRIAELRNEGNISELQALRQTFDERDRTLANEIAKQEEIVAAAKGGKNTQVQVEKEENELQKLTAARLLAKQKYDANVAKSTSKSHDEILKMTRQLTGAIDGEWEKAVATLQGDFAKTIKSLSLDMSEAEKSLSAAEALGDPALIEKWTGKVAAAKNELDSLGTVAGKFLDQAKLKDKFSELNGMFSQVSLGLSSLGSDVDKLESDMERDGGWVSRVFNTEQITTLINTRLPELRAEISRLKTELASLPAGSENSKEALKLQKDITKVEKEHDKFANYVPKVWKDVVGKVDSTFHEGFAKIFSKGKTDWSAFTKSLADSFRTTVMDSIYQMLARPMVMNVVANVTGSLGLTGLSDAASAQSGGSNLLGLGNSAYNAYSGGTGGLYGAAATSGIGQTLGLSQMTAAGSAMSAYSAGGSILAGTQSATLTSLGSTIGAAIPWVGIAAAVASMFMKSGGGPKKEGNSAYDFATDTLNNVSTYGGEDRDNQGGKAIIDALLTPVSTRIETIVKNLGGSLDGIQSSMFFNQDKAGDAPSEASATLYKDNKAIYWTSKESGRSDEDLQAGLEVVMQRLSIAAIKAAEGIEPVFKQILDGVDLTTATAAEMTQALSDVQSVVALREAFKNINLDAEALSVSLIKSAGGISSLNTNLNSYYQAYFTEAERTTKLTESVSASFAAMNIAMPDSLTGFRAIVEGLDLTTATGQAAFASLMNVQGAFASITNAAEASAKALKAEADAKTKAIADERNGLQDKYDGLTMNTVQLREKERNTLDASNRALYDQIKALEDQATAAETAATAAETAATAAETAATALQTLTDSATSSAESAFSNTQSLANEAASAAETAVTSALAGVQTAIDAEKERVKAAFDTDSEAIKSRISTLKSLDSQLKSAINNGYTPSLAGYQMAQNGLSLAASNMQAGVLPDSDALSQLIDRSKANTDWFATEADMMRSQARTDLALSSLSDSTSGQMSIAEQSLVAITSQRDATIKSLDDQMTAAKKQVDALHGIDTTAVSIDEAMSLLNSTSSKLRDAWEKQAQVGIAGKQLDELKGINSGMDTLAGAFQALNESIYALASASGKAASVPVSDYAGSNGANYTAATGTWSSSSGSATTSDMKTALVDIYKTSGATGVYNTATSVGLSLTDVDRITGMTAGTSVAETQANILADLQKTNAALGSQGVYDRAKALGLTLAQVDSITGMPAGAAEEWAKDHNLPKFAGGGSHAGGFRMVGENGPEIEYTPPSHIYSNQQSKNLIDIAPLLAEIKSLREELRAGQAASIGSTNKAASLLDRVINGEDSINTRAA